MQKPAAVSLFVLVLGLLLCFEAGAWAGFAYPCYLVDAYDPDGDGFEGMAVDGHWPIPVDPEKWLVGEPPSEVSGVTLPPDHWVELQFRGPIVDGPGADIVLIELGRRGEHALIFLTDGKEEEYPFALAIADNSGGHFPSVIELDLAALELPFEPRAVRILGLDRGGDAPGFDLANIQARISTDCEDERACNPFAVDGAERVGIEPSLYWSTGQRAQGHIVYFGSELADVSEQAQPVPQQPQDANSYQPGLLRLGTRYFWRVDEVSSGDKVATGEIWSFTTTERLVVDDFESYNGSDTRLEDSWIAEGWAYPYVVTEDRPVYAGRQAMGFSYYHDEDSPAKLLYAFDQPQDWQRLGIQVLELAFYGDQNNSSQSQLFLSISDGHNEILVEYEQEPNALLYPTWHIWRCEVGNLQEVQLNHITQIAIGVRSRPGEEPLIIPGTVYIDEIKLLSRLCLREHSCEGDFNGDCIVGTDDLQLLAGGWLETGYWVSAVQAPNSPVAWYRFDGNVLDSTGSYHGQIIGNPVFVEGVYGQAIQFDGQDDAVRIPQAKSLFARIKDAVTICFWQRGTDSPYHTDTICCSDYEYGRAGPAIAITLGCWRRPGWYSWQCGQPWSFESRLRHRHRFPNEWMGRWNHWAFSKRPAGGSDPSEAVMEIFLNGRRIAARRATGTTVGEVNSFVIGSGWYGGYDGIIDEFRIYDYALSEAEVAYVATNGSGVFDLPLLSPLDLCRDQIIDWRDFAIFAEHWLTDCRWP